MAFSEALVNLKRNRRYVDSAGAWEQSTEGWHGMQAMRGISWCLGTFDVEFDDTNHDEKDAKSSDALDFQVPSPASRPSSLVGKGAEIGDGKWGGDEEIRCGDIG